MAVNLYIVRKWTALTIPALLTGMAVAVCLIFYNFWISVIALLIFTLIFAFASNLLIKNPFTQMLEGAGILTIDLTSTGIINMFISTINKPYIENNKQKMHDIFDRETVHNLSVPIKAGKMTQNDDGSLTLDITKEDYNKARFGLLQYPCLIWNGQTKSLLTKDFLSEQEKISFSEHSIIYQNQKLHELTGVVRDFGRYVVELTKPNQKTNILQNKWFWIILIGALLILGILFAPSILATAKGTYATAAQSFNPTSMPTSPITPR
jgi:hypothetical protein